MSFKRQVACPMVLAIFVLTSAIISAPVCADTSNTSTYTDVLPFNPETFEKLGLKLLWRTYNPIGVSGAAKVHILSEYLLLEDPEGFLYCYNRLNGERLWHSYIVGGTEAPVSEDAENIYACSGTELVVIDKKTVERMKFDLPFPPSTAVESDENNLYIGSYNGRLYALDRKTQPQPPLNSWMFKWANSSSKTLSGKAFSNGMTVFYSSTDGYVRAAAAGDGYSIWRHKGNFDFIADVVPSISTWHKHDESVPDVDVKESPLIYAAGLDGYLYALYTLPLAEDVKESDIKQVKWRFFAGGMLKNPPVVCAETLYLSPANKGIVAVNAESGTENWIAPGAGSLVTVADNIYSVAAEGRELWKLEQEDGSLMWRMDVEPFAFHIQNPYDDIIFLVTQQGQVFAIIEE